MCALCWIATKAPAKKTHSQSWLSWHSHRQGAFAGCLAGLQAEWFDWTELESQDQSARPRIETSHVDLQDVRSAKLQACMKSAKPTHLTRGLERTKRFKRPGTELEWATTTGSWSMIGARARKQWSEWGLRHGLNRNQLAGSGRRRPDRTGLEALDGTSRGASIQTTVWSSCIYGANRQTDRQTDTHTHARNNVARSRLALTAQTRQ